MRVLQKLGITNDPDITEELVKGVFYYRRVSEGLEFQFITGDKCTVTAKSWDKLLSKIENAPKSWFVVTDNDESSNGVQVIYQIAKDNLEIEDSGEPNSNQPVPGFVLPAVAPVLLNEGTLNLYHGPVPRDHAPSSYARVYLWRRKKREK